ncbi:hypothetical protein CPA50_08355 [Marinobacter sp. ANT_B65]|nr:hypothetical protein CPA50_08355 [Marinobacter sp. ANT_B65]
MSWQLAKQRRLGPARNAMTGINLATANIPSGPSSETRSRFLGEGVLENIKPKKIEMPIIGAKAT